MGTLSKDLLAGPCEQGSVRISNTNRLLFALLNNTRFMEWAEEFQNQVESQIINAVTTEITTENQGQVYSELAAHLNRTYYYREIVQSMFECLDVETFEALINLDRETAITQSSATTAGVNVKLESPDKLVFTFGEPGSTDLGCQDCVVCISLVVDGVAFAAVFAVAFGAVFLAAPIQPDSLSRNDLQRVSELVMRELTQRANLLRQQGDLSITLPNRNVVFDSPME